MCVAAMYPCGAAQRLCASAFPLCVCTERKLLPHATFGGDDAQLDAALRYLEDEIKKDPRPVPEPPPYPDKAFTYAE